MASTNNAPSGAAASTSGLFSGFLDNLINSGTSLYIAKQQTDVAKAQAKADAEIAKITAARDTIADNNAAATATPLTSQPWFMPAVVIASVLGLGALLLALRRR